MALVTVILTVFKRTDYLEAAIKSVSAQSWSEWECLVADDANTSAAREVCGRFSEDPRVRYRARETTLGTALSIAAALCEVRGKYVAILNDDDVLYPRMLERLVAPLEANPGVVAAFGNHHVIDSAGAVLAKETEELMRERGRVRLAPGLVPDAFDFAVRYGLMAAMGCVFRRSAVDPSWLTKDLAGAYDYWLAVKLGGQGGFYFLPECVMGWRQHSDSLTHLAAPEEKFGGEEYIHYALLGTALPRPLRNYVRGNLSSFLFRRAGEHLRRGRRNDVSIARDLLRRSLKLKWRFVVFRCWLFMFVRYFAYRPHRRE